MTLFHRDQCSVCDWSFIARKNSKRKEQTPQGPLLNYVMGSSSPFSADEGIENMKLISRDVCFVLKPYSSYSPHKNMKHIFEIFLRSLDQSLYFSAVTSEWPRNSLVEIKQISYVPLLTA